jgi:hypothetical protein
MFSLASRIVKSHKGLGSSLSSRTGVPLLASFRPPSLSWFAAIPVLLVTFTIPVLLKARIAAAAHALVNRFFSIPRACACWVQSLPFSCFAYTIAPKIDTSAGIFKSNTLAHLERNIVTSQSQCRLRNQTWVVGRYFRCRLINFVAKSRSVAKFMKMASLPVLAIGTEA